MKPNARHFRKRSPDSQRHRPRHAALPILFRAQRVSLGAGEGYMMRPAQSFRSEDTVIYLHAVGAEVLAAARVSRNFVVEQETRQAVGAEIRGADVWAARSLLNRSHRSGLLIAVEPGRAEELAGSCMRWALMTSDRGVSRRVTSWKCKVLHHKSKPQPWFLRAQPSLDVTFAPSTAHLAGRC